MNKRLKELAARADAYVEPLRFSLGGQNYQQMRDKHLAELVRQDAMEEAAKICDELNYNGMNSLHCAQAIRNRAEEINE